MIRTILADDHRVFVDGLEKLLTDSTRFQVIAKYYDTRQLLSGIYQQPFELLVMDFEMPGPDCEETIQRTRMLRADACIVVLSMHEEGLYSKRALLAGANGFLSKTLDSDTLITTLLNIIRNGRATRLPSPSQKSKRLLSKQEMAIIKMIADGKTSKEIAEELRISELTIKVHRRNMIQKMGVSNSSELIKVAIMKGLL